MVSSELLLLIAVSCAALAIIVYLMWRAANQKAWQKFTSDAKSEWKEKEARLKR